MSDWQPGDLALCVDDTNLAMGRIRRGGLYTVEQVRVGRHVAHGECVCLDLRGVDDLFGYAAPRFRKIRPHTPDAEDAETIRLLTGKPVPEPAQ